MKLHRFYANPSHIELTHDFWLHDEHLRHQWTRVLRYRQGDELVLFDGAAHDRLYKIIEIAQDAVHLELVTEFERKLPSRHVYLFFSVLKKDKNDWLLQKCTELGVRNFIPVLAERCERSDLSQHRLERWEKIVIEAAEQCGRSDIPHIREPLSLRTVLEEYKDKVQLLVCDETLDKSEQLSDEPIGIFVGPEGGWTQSELTQFADAGAGHFHLGNLTLRAETAAVAAATKLLS